MSGITNDVQQIQVAVSETVGDLLREGLAVIGFACLMFYYDYKLALVVVTGAPIVVYPLVRLGQRVRRTSRRVQEELALPVAHHGRSLHRATASSRRSAPRRTRRRASSARRSGSIAPT